MRFASRLLLAFVAVFAATYLPAQASKQGAVLYRRSITRDLTADRRPETLTVVARGRSLDSASVTLTIRGMGRELFRDSWETADDFVEERTLRGAQRPSRDSLSRMERRRLARVLSDNAFDHAIEFHDPWSGAASDCESDARDCISFYLRYERDTAERVRRGLPPIPATGPDYSDFLKTIDAAPFDTSLVRRIGTDMRARHAVAFTFSYGYETTRTIAWSSVAKRFFVVFECC